MTRRTKKASTGSKRTRTKPRHTPARTPSPASTPSSQPADWTRSADGKYVDWTKPPYYVGGVLRLVLEGEDPELVAGAVAQKRIHEYYRLRWQAMGGRPRRFHHVDP